MDQDCLQRIKWAQGIVLVYDITNPSTLQLLSEIKTKVDQVKDIKCAAFLLRFSTFPSLSFFFF